MDDIVAINMGVIQIGTHVGVHIDFACRNLRAACDLREQMLIHAEAAKLLSTLGFDLSELEGLFEVDEYGTKED